MNTDNIANIIKDIRKKNNLTQMQLADILNVTYQAVSKWETGKSIPDLEILSNISKLYNVDFNTLIGIKKKTKVYKLIIIIIIIILICLAIFIKVLDNRKHNFELKQLVASCEEFTLTGSAAFNKEKASIIISKISYCGKEDNTKYKNINCSLYEESDKGSILISDCSKNETNITLDNYLNNIKIKVNNYDFACKKITNKTFYLEIKAYASENKIINYKIPLKIDDNC